MNKQEIKRKIKLLTEEYSREIVTVRRYLHTVPEIGFQEYNTSKYIIGKLKEYGIPYQMGVAGTGIVGTIHGRNSSKKTIALRADMDALQIKEENDVSFKSQHEGMMHACGHDAHMACVLGAAKILNEFKNEFEGTVKLIFQPSEEMLPGGAIKMIEGGVLENPKVENVFGQHTLPTLEAGKGGFKSGKYMASTDEIYITVHGKGGHAATPELYVNPLNIAATIILELEKEFNKNKPQDTTSVLAFGRITGDGRTNIIPDETKMEGTLRTFNEEWRAKAHHMIKSISDSIAKKMKGKCDVHIAIGYPVLVNNDELTEKAKQLAIEFLGRENVIDLEMRMTSEDFAYYAQKVPSVFYRFGVRNESKNIISNLHTSTFDIDEESLKTATGLMAWIAINQF
ncbi:MAG: M20 family metallopeptidase [Bacteroidota bacterium]